MSTLKKLRSRIKDATKDVKENVKANVKSVTGSITRRTSKRFNQEANIPRRPAYCGFACRFSSPAHALMNYRDQYSTPRKKPQPGRILINKCDSHASSKISITITPPTPAESRFGSGSLLVLGSAFHKLVMPSSNSNRNILILAVGLDDDKLINFHVHPTIVLNRCPYINRQLKQSGWTPPTYRKVDAQGRRLSLRSQVPAGPPLTIRIKEDPNYFLYALEFCYSGCYGVKNPRVNMIEDHGRIADMATRLEIGKLGMIAMAMVDGSTMLQRQRDERDMEMRLSRTPSSRRSKFSFMSETTG